MLTRCVLAAISSPMLRRFSFLLVTGFIFSSISLQASPLVLEILEKDGFKIEPSTAYEDMNPLRRVIRPDVSTKALNYAYHAWSEVDAKGEYPVYVWELLSPEEIIERKIVKAEDEDIYAIAKYWVAEPGEDNFFNELSDEDREPLLLDMESGVIHGALTLRTPRNDEDRKKLPPFYPSTDSKRYLLISKRPLTKAVKQKVEAPMVDVPRVEVTTPARIPPPPIPTTEAKVEQYPFATPVPGRPGFVYSLDVDENGKREIISVQGLAPGTKARAPNSKKIFLVP